MPYKRPPGCPKGPRLAPTVANLALSLAVIGRLMELEGVTTPTALARKRSGSKRRASGTGEIVSSYWTEKWSGATLVRPSDLEAFGAEYEEIGRLVRSPLFAVFSGGEPDEALAYGSPDDHPDPHVGLSLKSPFHQWTYSEDIAFPHLAGTGRWTAVEYLFNGIALQAGDDPRDVSLTRIQYLAVAMAMWARTLSGSRAAPLLWCLMRRRLLDDVSEEGWRVAFESVDFDARIAEAYALAPAAVITLVQSVPHAKGFSVFHVPRLVLPEHTAQWIKRSLPPCTEHERPRNAAPAWSLGLTHLSAELAPRARRLIAAELGSPPGGTTVGGRLGRNRAARMPATTAQPLAPSIGALFHL